MPTFTNSLFEIRTRQDYLGQECINTYFYSDDETGPAVGLANIATQFNADVLREVEGVQSDQITGIDLRVRKLGGTIEEIVDITGQTGERMGNPSPSFNAWGFSLFRTSIDVRNGAKRIAGLSETDTDSNEPTGAMLSLLNDLALVLAAKLILGNSAELSPVIFRRGSFLDPDWIGTLIAGAAFRKLTSQVSRKLTVE